MEEEGKRSGRIHDRLYWVLLATVGLLLHKPVIIGAVHATRRLSDGVQVSVDCARGIVQVMPQ